MVRRQLQFPLHFHFFYIKDKTGHSNNHFKIKFTVLKKHNLFDIIARQFKFDIF